MRRRAGTKHSSDVLNCIRTGSPGAETPLANSIGLNLRAGWSHCGRMTWEHVCDNIAWHSATAQLPMENNPQVVFQRLFGDGGTPDERAGRRRQAASLLDSALEDAAALARTLPSATTECASSAILTTYARSSAVSSSRVTACRTVSRCPQSQSACRAIRAAREAPVRSDIPRESRCGI